MRTLLVLRHGKSSWDDPSLADHDRPLKKRGRRAARSVGSQLAARGLLPDLVLSSTARRAKATARRCLAAAGGEPRQIATRELYGTGAGHHLELIADEAAATETTVMVVGHNPDLEKLVARLTGERVRLKTGYLAAIELPIDGWQQLAGARGRLALLLTP